MNDGTTAGPGDIFPLWCPSSSACVLIPLRAAKGVKVGGQQCWQMCENSLKLDSANMREFPTKMECNFQIFLIFCFHISSHTEKQTKEKQKLWQIAHLWGTETCPNIVTTWSSLHFVVN